MFNSRQAWFEMFYTNDTKVTECVDILNDYTNFPLGNRAAYEISDVISTYYDIPEMNYEGPNIRYDSNTNIFTFRIPSRTYEFEYIGIKAIKTVVNPKQYNYTYDDFITLCNQSTSITKRCGFNNSNLNEGIEYMPLNQQQEIQFWFQIPDTHENYAIRTLSQIYNNFVIEFDLIVRQNLK